jgi:hypothetical protein
MADGRHAMPGIGYHPIARASTRAPTLRIGFQIGRVEECYGVSSNTTPQPYGASHVVSPPYSAVPYKLPDASMISAPNG